MKDSVEDSICADSSGEAASVVSSAECSEMISVVGSEESLVVGSEESLVVGSEESLVVGSDGEDSLADSAEPSRI